MSNEERMQRLHKQLDMIQICINRMAQNSFIIKGWMITIVTILLSVDLWHSRSKVISCLIALLPILLFWFLDGYYLQLEKKYRLLYEWTLRNQNVVDHIFYDLNLNKMKEKKPNLLKVMFSKAVWPVYITGLLITALVVYCRS